MPRFIIKNCYVNAVQYNGDNYLEVVTDLKLLDKNVVSTNPLILNDHNKSKIPVQKGKWIIKGLNGELFTLTPWIFDCIYQRFKEDD